MKKLQDISFNLSQNILFDKQMTSLKHHSLVLHIASIFRSNKEEECIKKLEYYSASVEIHLLKNDWQIIENFLEENLRNDSKCTSCEQYLDTTYTKNIIHFMGRQIVDFIVKKSFGPYINVLYLLCNLVFTSQGTINMPKTVIRVIGEFSYSQLMKLAIICNQFLWEEIQDYYDRTPDDSKIYFTAKDMVNDYTLYFWMWKIRSRPSIPINYKDNPCYGKWLNPSILDKDALENIFLETVETNNEIAVEYLWINHIIKMEDRARILKTAFTVSVKNSSKTNILMFLLLQVNENELEEFFQENSITIILNIVKEVRWLCVFLKLFKVLKKYIDLDCFSEIFCSLIESHFQDYSSGVNLDILVNYFSLLDEYVKISLVKESTRHNNQSLYGRVLLKAFINSDDNMDLVIKLRIESNYLLKVFLKSESGLDLLSEAFKKGNIKFVFEVLKDFIKEGQSDFMKFFFIERKEELGDYFIKNFLIDKLMLFVNLFSKTLEKDTQDFKTKIFNDYGKFIIKKIIFPLKESWISENLKHANSVLIWFLKSSNNVYSFKDSIDLTVLHSPEEIFYDSVETCVLTSKFDFLSEFFRWKEVTEIEKFKILDKLLNDMFIIKRIVAMDNINEFLNNLKIFLFSHNIPFDFFLRFTERVFYELDVI